MNRTSSDRNLFNGGSLFPISSVFDELLRIADDKPVASPLAKPFLLNIHESEKGYEIKARLVSIKREDVDISFEDGVLIIEVAGESEDEPKHHFKEWSRPAGTRKVTLPKDADPESIEARLGEGVLTVTVRKLEALQPKKIAIS